MKINYENQSVEYGSFKKKMFILYLEAERYFKFISLSVYFIKIKKNSTCFYRPKADRRKVVKQFSRPAAGRGDTDPSQLRPAPVLSETVSYLFGR